MVKINNIKIPDNEIRFIFSRSSGPGGQNVNKVNTKATVKFDIMASKALGLEQKERIRKRLSGRISRNGILTVSSDRFRSQQANRKDALDRLSRLLSEALRVKPKRKKTSIPKAAKERRLREKRHRGEIKKTRRKDYYFE